MFSKQDPEAHKTFRASLLIRQPCLQNFKLSKGPHGSFGMHNETHAAQHDASRPQGTTCWDQLWSTAEPGAGLDSLSLALENILVRLRPSWTSSSILEAGCGSGQISLRLARRGAKVNLLDLSREALRLAHRLREGTEATLVRGDLLSLPFARESFDLTWNAGVLEHLTADNQDRAISEMARVTRRGGYIVSFNPNRASVPYRIGKRFQERNGTWRYGYEEPIRSLASFFTRHTVVLLREYDIGIGRSFSFLPGIPRRVVRTLDRVEPVLRFIGTRGYLVVSIGQRL